MQVEQKLEKKLFTWWKNSNFTQPAPKFRQMPALQSQLLDLAARLTHIYIIHVSTQTPARSSQFQQFAFFFHMRKVLRPWLEWWRQPCAAPEQTLGSQWSHLGWCRPSTGSGRSSSQAPDRRRSWNRVVQVAVAHREILRGCGCPALKFDTHIAIRHHTSKHLGFYRKKTVVLISSVIFLITLD